MSVSGISGVSDILISGLRAETARMNAIAGNIANANTTRTPSGEPYRRKEVVLSTADEGIAGVQVDGVVSDASDFKQVYQPGHPDADARGYVRMPNVDLPVEMIHMLAASRAYQAGTTMLRRYSEISEMTIELLR